MGSSIQESRANTQLILDLLQQLGFAINWEKSPLDPTQSLTFLSLSINSLTRSFSLSEKKKNPQNKFQQMMCNPKLHRHIGGCLPRHPEGPSLLEALTNTAHKVSTYISSQLRDTCVPEQQCSGRTTVVATEFRDCERELNLSPSARSIHTFRRIQSSLGRMLPGPNRKRSLVSPLEAAQHIIVLQLKAAFLAWTTPQL